MASSRRAAPGQPLWPLRRAILIHGFGGHPLHGWRPWLKEELEKSGWAVSAPFMPDPDHPQCGEWVETISREVGTPTSACALVGHSLGCMAILRYLQTLPAGQNVGPVILVAGFGRDIHKPEMASFCTPELDWDLIRPRATRFVVVHSDNDPLLPLEEGQYVARHLGVELIVKKGMGHFSSSEGTTQLPVVLQKLLEK
ncbi:Serine hydrolase [uncultured archaeon]|nr:Serine hydrolase [uncultured archaeon]